MSGFVKQRKDLLEEGLNIPYWLNWDDMKGNETEPTTNKYIELDYWIQSFGQDDDGVVFTSMGLFYSIDLDYKEAE